MRWMFSLQSDVHLAMMINIKADALYTIMDTEFWAPLKMAMNNTSKSMKLSVRPLAAHSVAISGLFSSDIDPEPSTTDFVGMV
jgi:hypothetical protein